MYIRVFGGGVTVLPEGWTDETVLSVMSGAPIDATATPGDRARLTVISIFAGTKVVVPLGARIRLSGGDVLGSHSVKVEPGHGPEIEVQAIPIMGSVKVRTPRPVEPFR